jgi:hypothetical protein
VSEPEFNIRDIVKLRNNDDILFMVVDVADFSTVAKNGKELIDIDYEMMQIYPIQKTGKYLTVAQNDIVLHHKSDSRNYQQLLKFIQKDREAKGWYGIPDFLVLAEKNARAEANNREKKVKMPMQKQDIIRYDTIKTIDECLDAYIHLTMLYELFEDEAYLQLRELIEGRIKWLSK